MDLEHSDTDLPRLQNARDMHAAVTAFASASVSDAAAVCYQYFYL
jgi:hypothetical protein